MGKEDQVGCKASQNCWQCKGPPYESYCSFHSPLKNLLLMLFGILLQNEIPREGLCILLSCSGAQVCPNSPLAGAGVEEMAWLCLLSHSQGDSAVPSCCDLPACAELSSLLLWASYVLDSLVQYILLLNVFDAAMHHRHRTPQTNLVCWVCVEKEPS